MGTIKERNGVNLTEAEDVKKSWQEYTESEVAQLCPTLCNPMDYIAYKAPLSMGFSRQVCWSGLAFPFPVLWPLMSFPDLLAYGVQPF